LFSLSKAFIDSDDEEDYDDVPPNTSDNVPVATTSDAQDN
jgi:hypothetical protein